MILDFRSYWPDLKKKPTANYKYICNEKSIKLTDLIRFLLASTGNRTNAKSVDCRYIYI